MRPTWPRSAAKTPSWQVSEDSTRIVVLTVANGTLSFSVSCGPQLGAHRADREVGREQGREEHQLAGEPDDRAHADHAGSVVMPVQAGCRDRSCSRHAIIMAHRPASEVTPTPGASLRPIVVDMLTTGAAELDLPPFTWDRVFTDWGLDPWLFVATVWVAGLYLSGCGRCAAAATAGRWARTLAFVVVGMGLVLLRDPVGARGVRHHAAERAHGPAHDAVDGGAAGAGARGAGDPGAAHAAAQRRGAGCWRCCTRGWPGCCPSRR